MTCTYFIHVSTQKRTSTCFIITVYALNALSPLPPPADALRWTALSVTFTSGNDNILVFTYTLIARWKCLESATCTNSIRPWSTDIPHPAVLTISMVKLPAEGHFNLYFPGNVNLISNTLHTVGLFCQKMAEKVHCHW
jgi:hypothetical protein